MQKWSQRCSPKNKSKEEFLATKQITLLEHLAYSPDLAPNDFFMSPKIKEILKGRHFDDIDDIKRNMNTIMYSLYCLAPTCFCIVAIFREVTLKFL